MKAWIKYNGYTIDRVKTLIVVQGHIIKETQLQIVISVNDTPRTIRKKDIIRMHYEEDLEDIKYASV